MLKISQVKKYYNERLVLEDVNILIKSNIILGLAGFSGCGKSTLLRCIQGLEKIDGGEIEFDGATGFVFQDFHLFPHMTVMENIVYAPNIYWKKEDNLNKADGLLKKLSIYDQRDKLPAMLSGGQKQRAALARSLMMRPALLLCDEPTSGLDFATTDDVSALLKSVHSMGVMMIIASHDLDFLAKTADRIVILKKGHIVMDVNTTKSENFINELKSYY